MGKKATTFPSKLTPMPPDETAKTTQTVEPPSTETGQTAKVVKDGAKVPDASTIITPQPAATPPAPIPAAEPASPEPEAEKKAKGKTKAKAKTKTQKVKPKAKAKAQPRAKPNLDVEKNFIQLGDYKIRVRPGSAFSAFYRVLGKECNFADMDKDLAAFDPEVEKQCVDVLKTHFVLRDRFETLLRGDHEYKGHCEAKTKWLKAQAAKGDAKAKAVLANPKRVINGTWAGNVREMISALTGSTSNEADNRNIEKFAKAHIVFRQFPRSPHKDQKVYLTMVPSKFLPKINKALRQIFGDERANDFSKQLASKTKEIFG